MALSNTILRSVLTIVVICARCSVADARALRGATSYSVAKASGGSATAFAYASSSASSSGSPANPKARGSTPSNPPPAETASTNGAAPESPQTASSGAPTAAAPTGSSWSDDVLALHNKLRARHGAPPLSWSSYLASGAQSWAEGCVMQHSGGSYGENLAMGHDVLAGVQAWYDEASQYNYANGGFSEATGHFTQMVWKASAELGCGFAPGCKLLVCRYSPPGNVEGQYQDNVFPPSS